MKQAQRLCVLVIVLLLLTGCGQQQQQMSYIGMEKAKQVALEACGLSTTEAEAMTAQLASRNGLDYYQVSFTAAGQNYQYNIDALTGVVIADDTPSAAPENSLVTDADTYEATGEMVQTVQAAQEEATVPQASTGEAGVANSSSQTAAVLTVAEAQKAVLAHAGFSDDQVTFSKSKLEKKHETQVYKIEFYTKDHQEYEYEMNAYSGEIISFDYDAKTSAASDVASKQALTAEEAKALALAQVPGAAVGDIQEFEVDYDDGRVEYEGKIVYDGMKYEFEIDGYSGAIRSWEAEVVGTKQKAK